MCGKKHVLIKHNLNWEGVGGNILTNHIFGKLDPVISAIVVNSIYYSKFNFSERRKKYSSVINI